MKGWNIFVKFCPQFTGWQFIRADGDVGIRALKDIPAETLSAAVSYAVELSAVPLGIQIRESTIVPSFGL
ncbi:hypothetical protein FRB94_007487 [Tulasnella sp. JGI-2019a]|nr:hypothetical protein FRB94_007487 [Tulasnella sp. JGI-2019a]